MRSTDPGAQEVNERYVILANLKCNMETTPSSPPRLTFKVGDAFPTFTKGTDRTVLQPEPRPNVHL